VLRELNLTLTTYSLAPCWDEELPYYGLFIERGDLWNSEQATRLAEVLDDRLARLNMEYSSKRNSARLGRVRLELLPSGAWQEWDRKRLVRSGGTLEQYKHPCLIPDLRLRETLPVEQEIGC
jgi:hypothetical protein